MHQHLLQIYRSGTYDFRAYVCPEDPSSHLFEEWVDKYRMNWAVAKLLQPATILEIGIGYGYSARAFLEANPQARLVGIALDEPSTADKEAALKWVKQSLRDFDMELIVNTARNQLSIPSGAFDLIHVHGGQDADSLYHQLDLALIQARHILVDGYQSDRINNLAVNEWLWFNKAAIESILLIPGLSGNLIVTSKLDGKPADGGKVDSSLSLADSYTTDYYLGDCGGFMEWRRSRGRIIDPRLQAVAEVGMGLGKPSAVVDLGAGRGELTRLFSQQGIRVTSIDYSSDAVQLINKTLEDDPASAQNVTVICGSVLNSSAYTDKYDLAIAADIVEHMTPGELDSLYRLLSKKLKKKKGALVVHTFPNQWLYRYEHPRQQKAAKGVGCWLPKARRTWFERIMHINEQNPRILKRQLSRHFPHVLLWFAEENDMVGSLARRYRVSELRRAPSLFAVASHKPIDRDRVVASLRSVALSEEDARGVSLTVREFPDEVLSGRTFTVRVTLGNTCNRRFLSFPPYPFMLSYHWKDNAGAIVEYNGLRTAVVPSVPMGESFDFRVNVRAPDEPGQYRLRVVPVQEGVQWFEDSNREADLPVRVLEPPRGLG